MNCPKCGKEMEEGYIYSGVRTTPILYYPKGLKPTFWQYGFSKKRFFKEGRLSIECDRKETMYQIRLHGHRAIAYVCKDCRIGFFEYDPELPEKPKEDWYR